MLKTKKKVCLKELIQDKLAKGHEIRPFPRVVTQLLGVLKDPNVNSSTAAKIIEADVALSTRILRMANSPVFGFSNVISSIEHATTILGIGPLKSLALTFAGATMFRNGGEGKASQEAMWNHSLGCATTAREIAKSASSVNPDDAFLAGIFHDVGKLFFYDVVRDEYTALTADHWGRPLIALEREHFGVTHEEVGSKLTTTWQLAEQITVAVGYHHQPENAIAHNELTAVVSVADSLARAAGIGSSPDSTVDILAMPASEPFGFDEQSLEKIKEQSLQMFEETRQAYAS